MNDYATVSPREEVQDGVETGSFIALFYVLHVLWISLDFTPDTFLISRVTERGRGSVYRIYSGFSWADILSI